MAAQSVAKWDFGSDGYRVNMAENVSSTASISFTIDGGSAESAFLSSDIALLVELDEGYTCPLGSSLTITNDTSSYNATID
ncbi:hypothetical protein N9N22_01820 [Alphaproteobacteria bacterium]|nr:hypothetical protein [Alphaproteobacteria bacterium]